MIAVEPTSAMDALLNTVRMLPVELIREVADFAEFLGKKHASNNLAIPADVSWEWTDDDMRDFSASACQRLDDIPPAIPDPEALLRATSLNS